jgi:ABC-type multidrug transport system fused ATPase/permease subunit
MITAQHLEVRAGARLLMQDVSFRVAPGETVALVGPTGSGKTSTMALVHRLYGAMGVKG